MKKRRDKPTVSAEQAAQAYRRAFPEIDPTAPACRCHNCEPPLARRILSWRRSKTSQQLSLTGACRERTGSLGSRERPSAVAAIPRSKHS